MPINADELHTFLRSRRSIRHFKPHPVPGEVVERLVETATFAPSAHNLQPWRFVILTTMDVKTRLGEVLTNAMRADMLSEGIDGSNIERRVFTSLRRLDQAPVVILLCLDASAVREHKPEDKIMSIQSVSNAGLQLLLAAHAEGLGGNWICWPLYAQKETQKALELSDDWEPQALFFLGYPAEKPKPKDERTSDVIIRK